MKMHEIIVVSRIDGLPNHNDIGKLVEHCSGLPVLVVNIQKNIADEAKKHLLAVLDLLSESLRQLSRSNGLGDENSIIRLIPAYGKLQDILTDSLNKEAYNFLSENLPCSYRFIGDFPFDWLEINGIPLALAAPSSRCLLPEYYDNMTLLPSTPRRNEGRLTAEDLIYLRKMQRVRLLGVKYRKSSLCLVHKLGKNASVLLKKFSQKAGEDDINVIGGFKEYKKNSVKNLLKQFSRYFIFLGHASHEGLLLSDESLLRVEEFPDIAQYGSAILLACGTGLTIGNNLSLAQYFHRHGARDTFAIQLPFATLRYLDEQLPTIMSNLIKVSGLHPRFSEIVFINRFSLIYTFYFYMISHLARVPINPDLKIISPFEADYDKIYRDRWGRMWHTFCKDILDILGKYKGPEKQKFLITPLKAIGLSIAYLRR